MAANITKRETSASWQKSKPTPLKQFFGEKKANLNLIESLNSITNYQEMYKEKHIKRHHGDAISKIQNEGDLLAYKGRGFFSKKKKTGRKKSAEGEGYT